jgi:beta-lactamase regulating signal transducer with metallopeptidase domain
LPVCAALAFALGLGLLGWVGCTYISPTVAGIAASLAVVLLGALVSSLVVNLRHARKAIGLAAQVATDIRDPGRLADVAAIAGALGTAPPILRVVPLDAPVAFTVQATVPAIVVSTWVLEQLDPGEWRAVIAHELAHLRRGDRLVRWTGCWLLGASRLIPGSQAAWRRLEHATEAAADEAAATLEEPASLASARRKFGGAQAASPAELAMAWAPATRSSRWAAACVGLVFSLPLVPFALVPLCAMVCER